MAWVTHDFDTNSITFLSRTNTDTRSNTITTPVLIVLLFLSRI